MAGGERKLLVTGATGVLGPSVLAAFGAHRCIALRHTTPVADSRVEVIKGDLTAPLLGLRRADYDRLLSRIDGVLHAGAITTAAWPAAELARTNVTGTRHVVTLAEHAGVPLHHISTFYVQGRDGTDTTEAANAYQATKRAAEDVVRTATVPAAVYRLPILIGDTTTGVTTHFRGQAIYAGAKGIVCGNAHIMPIPAQSYLDFLPRDHVAACLRIGIGAGLVGDHWIVAGDAAISFTQFVDECVAVGRAMGRDVVRPKPVDPDVVERLILPAFGDVVPAPLRSQLRVVNKIARGMALERRLPNPRDTLPDEVIFPPVPDLLSALRLSLRYWADNVRLPLPVKLPEGPHGSPHRSTV